MSSKSEKDISIDFAADEELTSLTAEQQEDLRRADPMNSGFVWYTPPMALEHSDHLTGGHHWIISGHDMQVLSMTVPPGTNLSPTEFFNDIA